MLRTSLFAMCIVAGHCHQRWRCPAPRSPDTGSLCVPRGVVCAQSVTSAWVLGIKTWSCGAETSSFGTPIMEVAAGPLTVVYEESVAHAGVPS
jgi:hypothetical protein